MHKTRTALLALCLALVLSGMACSDEKMGFTGNHILPSDVNDSGREVGYQVGDIAPEFNIPLTTGETVSYSTFRSDRTPLFLFFFSPF